MTDPNKPRPEDERRAQTLRRIALNCRRGMADARDSELLSAIADELHPGCPIVPDSPSGDQPAHVQV